MQIEKKKSTRPRKTCPSTPFHPLLFPAPSRMQGQTLQAVCSFPRTRQENLYDPIRPFALPSPQDFAHTIPQPMWQAFRRSSTRQIGTRSVVNILLDPPCSCPFLFSSSAHPPQPVCWENHCFAGKVLRWAKSRAKGRQEAFVHPLGPPFFKPLRRCRPCFVTSFSRGRTGHSCRMACSCTRKATRTTVLSPPVQVKKAADVATLCSQKMWHQAYCCIAISVRMNAVKNKEDQSCSVASFNENRACPLVFV